MHPTGSSLSWCLRSAVQLGIRITPPCEQPQCAWRLDAGAPWDLWSSESHRHVLLVQLQLAAGHPRFAGTCLKTWMDFPDWKVLNYVCKLGHTVGGLMVLSSWRDSLEYRRVRHAAVVSVMLLETQ